MVDDIVLFVNIALGNALTSACTAGEVAGTHVTITEILQAVNAALNGCPTCSKQVSVDSRTFTVSAGVASSGRVTLNLTYARQNGNADITETIDRAGQRVLSIQAQGTASRNTVTIDFGAGFHGIQHIVASTDGHIVNMTIDGRALSPIPPGTSPNSATFLDGAPPPQVSIDPGTIDAISPIQAEVASQMPTCGAATGRANARRAAVDGSTLPPIVEGAHPLDVEADVCNAVCSLFGDTCSCCSDCCNAAWATCAYSALLGFGACEAATTGTATVGCWVAYAFAEEGCFDEGANCNDACSSGSACCGPTCSGGSTRQGCAGPVCSPGTVCCGSGQFQTCCFLESDCCGGQCLEGIYAGARCIDPVRGIFCEAGEGDVCGGASCCPANTPICRVNDATSPLCCVAAAGDVCNGNRLCCPASAPACMSDKACCGPNDVLCGNSNACCPPPGACAGDACCNPPDQVCGTSCCNTSEICTPARQICCGPDVFGAVQCGNDCCVGNEVCLNTLNGAMCCPSSQACANIYLGVFCCPSGASCVNGTCSACEAGTVPCQFGTANPVFCCESAQSCTATGCCPSGQINCLGVGCRNPPCEL